MWCLFLRPPHDHLLNSQGTVPGVRPSTRLWSLPSPGLGGTWGRCNWSYWPRRMEDWAHHRTPPPGRAAGSSVSPAPDLGFPRGKSCPWTFGRLKGGGLIPPSLQGRSPGCRGTRPETEPVKTEGRGGRSRSCSLVRSSHPGTLWRNRGTHRVRLWIYIKKHSVSQSAVCSSSSTHNSNTFPKWWNWSCPISNQPVSNSLIWVYKQLHTSPPQFSRLFTHCIHLPHSFSSQPCVRPPIDSPAETSGSGWGTPKWDPSLPCSPARSRQLHLFVMSHAASSNIAPPLPSLGFGYFLGCPDHSALFQACNPAGALFLFFSNLSPSESPCWFVHVSCFVLKSANARAETRDCSV